VHPEYAPTRKPDWITGRLSPEIRNAGSGRIGKGTASAVPLKVENDKGFSP